MSPTIKELRVLHNLPSSMSARSALNAVIRRKWPGGEELLDVIERLVQMQHGRASPDEALQDMLDKLSAGRDKIAEAILADGLLVKSNKSGANEGKYRPGAPLAEDRINYAAVDWSKSDAELARIHGVSRQNMQIQRKRHGPKE